MKLHPMKLSQCTYIYVYHTKECVRNAKEFVNRKFGIVTSDHTWDFTQMWPGFMLKMRSGKGKRV